MKKLNASFQCSNLAYMDYKVVDEGVAMIKKYLGFIAYLINRYLLEEELINSFVNTYFLRLISYFPNLFSHTHTRKYTKANKQISK